MATNKPSRGIGPVPEGLGEGLTDFLHQLRRQALDVMAGRTAVSGSGSSGGSGGSTIIIGGPGSGGTVEPDLTPPPTPTGVNVVAGIDFVGVTSDPPVFAQGHGYLATLVYGKKYAGSGPLPTYSDNSKQFEFTGEVGTFPTDPATQWHIWVKWKTKDGVVSLAPAGGTNGFQVTTGQDVSKLLTALAAKIRNEQLDPTSNFIYRVNSFTIAPPAGTSGVANIVPFSVLTVPTLTSAGELLPAGVYMEAAYIKNLDVALGRFQNAFITNAMIVSVSASRITSGVISVGNYIQSSNYVPGTSGWRIHGNGAGEFRGLQIGGDSYFDGQVTIRAPDGRIILQSGGKLAAGDITPDSGWLNSNQQWGEVQGRPPEDAIRNNLIDLGWWRAGATIPWAQNREVNTLYSTAEISNNIGGPKGSHDVVWYCREAAGDGLEGGGWDAPNALLLDPSKTYRFALPIYKRDGVGGSAYWGPQPYTVCHNNTTNLHDNPYFGWTGRDGMLTDRWYLFVGYVYPQGSTGNSNDGAGIWDCKTGAKVVDGYSFCHAAGGAKGHRAYQYYAGIGSTQLFGRPMVNVVDGTEPSLREYFAPGAVLNSALEPSITAAAQAAAAAQQSAAAAQSVLATMRSNGYLDASEKPEVIRRWLATVDERAGIVAQANAYGIVAARNSYTDAHDALNAYLSSLSPAYNNTTTDTPITPATDQATWNAYYSARQSLLNSIADEAGKRAAWSGVSGPGKPQDNATVGATLGVNVSGKITQLNASTLIDTAAINGAMIGELIAENIVLTQLSRAQNGLPSGAALSGRRVQSVPGGLEFYRDNGTRSVVIVA